MPPTRGLAIRIGATEKGEASLGRLTTSHPKKYNLGFDFGQDRIRAFADYLRAVDPYGHPITVHSARDPLEALRFTFGDERLSLTSIQLGPPPSPNRIGPY